MHCFGLFVIAAFCATANLVAANRPLICYWQATRNDTHFSGNSLSIPIDKCSHIIYAHLWLDPLTNKVDYLDLSQNMGELGEFVALKKWKPDLKVTFAVGSWFLESNAYSDMASTDKGRATFAKSVDSVIQQYGFDGVDLNWKYPGDRDSDKANFVLLLKVLRFMIGARKLLSISTSPDVRLVPDERSSKIGEISQLVDYIFVRHHDFRMPNDVANRLTTSRRPNFGHVDTSTKGLTDTITAWEKEGTPRLKLIMGFDFFGGAYLYTFPNVSDTETGNFTVGAGQQWNSSEESDLLAYNEICQLLEQEEGWIYSKGRSIGSMSYAHKDDRLIVYEDQQSVTDKASIVKLTGGGAVVWSVNMDDSTGACGRGSYPLLSALSEHLNSKTKPDPIKDKDIPKKRVEGRKKVKSESRNVEKGLDIGAVILASLSLLVIISFAWFSWCQRAAHRVIVLPEGFLRRIVLIECGNVSE